ncbi:MAG TPA: prolyl oligopeptidase family serine peptidase [Polyangiaceae bacterium]|nr:prolyl oligopeptidase family serine peptidase [Polyangiaceae bacterium]
MCMLQVNGTTRSYYLKLPTGYDGSTPYPVVFQFHPLGGSASEALFMYQGIGTGFPNAIYITPQGLPSDADGGNPGWANTNNEDMNFTMQMLAQAQADYCVDNARIFSVGFSYGGMMSYAVGLEEPSVFRAIAPMSGALYSDQRGQNHAHPIAMWGSHGTSDDVVPIADGRSARDQILSENNCGDQTMPIDPSPCVAYQGCDTGYPVTWCEWDGGHGIPSFGNSAIAAFLKQF